LPREEVLILNNEKIVEKEKNTPHYQSVGNNHTTIKPRSTSKGCEKKCIRDAAKAECPQKPKITEVPKGGGGGKQQQYRTEKKDPLFPRLRLTLEGK